jgi:hypothetical protein
MLLLSLVASDSWRLQRSQSQRLSARAFCDHLGTAADVFTVTLYFVKDVYAEIPPAPAASNRQP